MAQELAAAFGVGEDDKHIHSIGVAGVAFAAIQVILQMIREQACRNEFASLRSPVLRCAVLPAIDSSVR